MNGNQTDYLDYVRRIYSLEEARVLERDRIDGEKQEMVDLLSFGGLAALVLTGAILIGSIMTKSKSNLDTQIRPLPVAEPVPSYVSHKGLD